MKIRVRAIDLLPGDIVSSGETVICVGTKPLGTEIERRKAFIRLDKNGKVRVADWNKSTTIMVERNENVQ